MNTSKPLIIRNVTHSLTILAGGWHEFPEVSHRKDTKPNCKQIAEHLERSLMLVTALSPVIGYDKASQVAHKAREEDLTLRMPPCGWDSSQQRSSTGSWIPRK